MAKKRLWSNCRQHFAIHLDGLKKTMRKVSHLADAKTEVRTGQSRCPVSSCSKTGVLNCKIIVLRNSTFKATSREVAHVDTTVRLTVVAEVPYI